MKLFKHTLSINFLNHAFITSILSSICILTAILILIFKGLNLTIEFTGGTTLNLLVPKTEVSKFRLQAQKALGDNLQIVEVSSDDNKSNFLLRMKFIENEQIIVNSLKAFYPELKIKGIDSFGPKLGSELQSNARNAIIIALLLISIYISLRFDRYYALGSVAALVHDVLFTLGLLSILNIEIGISIIAGLLTIVGYSLNDTIVVYDRIRENTSKLINDKKRAIINRSLNETLNRTVITSITTMIVVVVLFFYGGIVLQSFAITLIIGICVGTYSSIYIASPIMFYFEEKYPIPEFIDEEV
jgi:preprotein translocase subunit SecF